MTFSLSGETETISVDCMHKLLIINNRVNLVAIAVSATTRTVSGTMLRTSSKHKNSLLKFSPL